MANSRIPRRPLALKTGPKRGKGRFSRPTFGQAAHVLGMLGSLVNIAHALDLSVMALHKWRSAAPYGSDGIIPPRHVAALMTYARMRGIVIEDEDWAPRRINYETNPEGNPFDD